MARLDRAAARAQQYEDRLADRIAGTIWSLIISAVLLAALTTVFVLITGFTPGGKGL